ncbi:MAG TPA: hypothetical protein VJ249_11075 [Candidatus Bathyarchaeia archaeon]|nr:hypothetical protein [Candidatus Bathyarchaeia archaeon]
MATPFDNDLKKAVNLLRELVCMSFDKQWNIHSAIGSKYGELFVASELREHEPIIGKKRNELKGVSRPTSSDIVLYETQKKVEVKWGMLHHRDGDYYFDTRGKIPYWGWGFGSKGSQFKNSKFDYCVLLAATKNDAEPKHIFVLTLQEMKKGMKDRISGEAGKKKKSYFIETSDENNFFDRRLNTKFGIQPLEIEKSLLNRSLHKRRWEELKRNGLLKD